MSHQQHLGSAWLEKDKNGNQYIRTNCMFGRGKLYLFPNNFKSDPRQPDFVVVSKFPNDEKPRAVEEKKDV